MYEISRREIRGVARTLARSFRADPLFEHFFPDPANRDRLAVHTFRFIVAHALRRGEVHAVSAQLEGAAVWLPSTRLRRGLVDQVRFGALSMCMAQGAGAIGRQLRASEHMQSVHHAQLPGPHLYLSTIGVESAHRGRGLASRLLRPVLEGADRDRLPCYLDTHNERNLAIYQGLGFRIVHESVIPGSRVRHWAMIRGVQ